MLKTARFTANPEICEAQRRLAQIAAKLLLIEHEIFEIRQQLPLAAAHLAMEEESIPYNVAGHLYVKLGQVQAQCLRRGARELLVSSKANDQDLALGFHQLAIERDDEDLGPEGFDDLDRRRIEVLRNWPQKFHGESDDDSETPTP